MRASASSLVFTFIYMILRVRVHACVCVIYIHIQFILSFYVQAKTLSYIYISTTPYNPCYALGLKLGVSISDTFAKFRNTWPVCIE